MNQIYERLAFIAQKNEKIFNLMIYDRQWNMIDEVSFQFLKVV